MGRRTCHRSAYEADAAALAPVDEFVGRFADPDQSTMREGPFGPIVAVPADAPLMDRTLGITGRDPEWSPDSAV